ncbi:MAG: DNA-directed RNA polymerase subunit alpha [Phycisphaerae bacterium]|nr:DNA-directed RNA polymerase subunit alpha [Phycisphaerae bacterium]
MPPEERIPDSAEISELDLSVRTRRSLEHAGIRTVGELRRWSDEALLKIRNFTSRCLAEVRPLLANTSPEGRVSRRTPAVYSGRVCAGHVELDEGVRLPDGAKVSVQLCDPDEADAQALSEALLNLAGSVKNLPADFSEHHDHYLHGRGR